MLAHVPATPIVRGATLAIAAALVAGAVAVSRAAPSLRRASHAASSTARAFDDKDARRIVARNVFCSGCGAGGGCDGGGPSASTSTSTLGREVALLATVVVPHDPRESRALVASVVGPARPPAMVAPGDRLLDTGAAVIAIAPRRLVVRRDGGPLEVLRIDAALASASTALPVAASTDRAVRCATPERCTVERALVERAAADPQLLRGARALPAVRDGRPFGWRLFGVSAASPVGALGLANGDVITAVDGTPIPTVDALLGVYAKLRDAPRVTLTIERADATRALEVTLR